MACLYLVGIGPGKPELFTAEVDKCLREVEVIVGYTTYVKLIQAYFPEQKYWDSGMRDEIERCRKALELTAEGKEVAMVCSGDAGIYGMAGLCYELKEKHKFTSVEIKVLPGITAASSGAALLGSPLTNDFVVISLSDLLTPWDLIVKRLEMAAAGDFVTVLYNPGSIKRHDHLQKAVDIFLKKASPSTVCGICRKIGREGEEAKLCTLAELRDYPVDMLTTVFIGNSFTRDIDGKMVTMRGYEKKEEF